MQEKLENKSCSNKLKFGEVPGRLVSGNPKSSIFWNLLLSNSKTGESPPKSIFGFPNKGQSISKCLFGVFTFSQKMNETIRLYYVLVNLLSFVFWEQVKTPKRNFEIIWPLGVHFFSD